MNLYHDRLSKSGFQFMEKLLYETKTYETAIQNLQYQLDNILGDMCTLKAATIDDMPHGTGTSSPTENMAMKRADNVQVKYLRNRINEMQRHKYAINTAMSYLTDTERLFIKLRYDLERAPLSCLKEMHIEKSRWYELRQEIIQKIAGYIGIY